MALLEERVALLEVLRRALAQPGHLRADRRRERRAGPAVARRRRRRLRARPAPARHRVGDRPGAAWTTPSRSRTSARSPACSRASSRTSTDGPPGDPTRPLRGARRPARRRRRPDQEGVPDARARAASRRQHRGPAGRGEVQGGRRGLRDPLRPRAARDLRPLRPRGPALRRLPAELRPVRLAQRPLRGVLRRRRRRRSSAAARAARRRAATSASSSSSSSPRPRRGGAFAVSYEAVARCEHCRGNGAEPGTPIETCEPLRRRRTPAGGHAHAVRADDAHRRLRRLRRRRPRPDTARAPSAAAAAASSRDRTVTVEVPAGHRRRPARADRRAAATSASPAARPATSTC